MNDLFDIQDLNEDELREKLATLRSNRAQYGIRTKKQKKINPYKDLSPEILAKIIQSLREKGLIK